MALTLPPAGAIEPNFISHHFRLDRHVAAFAVSALLFGQRWADFELGCIHRGMPLLVGVGLGSSLHLARRDYPAPPPADGYARGRRPAGRWPP
ncbi:DUF817 domain-containing protein [Methylobacterium sp. BTF04]|nr:DUF817 domain-containing protein [Methylobacterium sp. BTF04]